MIVGSEAGFWALMAVLFVATVAVGLIGVVFAYSAVVRGQGLGYRPTGLAVGALLVLAGAWSIPVLVLALQTDMSAPSPPTDIGPMVAISLGALASVPTALAYSSFVAARPRRPLRRPGVRPRRHRYRAWSHVVAAATVAATAWGWTADGFTLAYRVGFAGLVLAVALRRLDRLFTAQAESFPAEISGHVLYLRPFRTEGRALFRLPDGKAEFVGNGLRSYVALDEFLVRGAGDRLGPVVALGNPAEFVPRGGATRVYLDDGTWTAELARLADRAQIIVIEPGRTESMRWELKYIAREGLQTKLFVVTTPYRPGAGWSRSLLSAMDRLNGWEPTSWPTFADEMRTVGLDLVADPGAGAVVTFRPDGSSVVVARGLTTPAMFAGAILGAVPR